MVKSMAKKKTHNSEDTSMVKNEIPPEVKEKLEKIKAKVETFKENILKKFDKYILGVGILPPPKPKEGETIDKDKIYTLVVIDDTDSKRMTKDDLKNKLGVIIQKMAKDTDKHLDVEILILSEIWQSCYDGKNEILQKIALSIPIFDKGLLKTLKVTEIHKSMVLKKFEKYIVTYTLGGSIYKGTASEESDIDIFIIVDDTDVKRMSRGELRDKLRAIMYGLAAEAGDITGIKNKLHLQVWILTDYWEGLKESSPVIVDVLRHNIPLYDRGMFMPWKQLLNMGKIRPSPEAIDMFMNTGEQALKRVQFKLKDMAMDDIFLSILTPTQAALMLYGAQPLGPKETPTQLRELFVKEGLLEEKYVKILEDNLKIRKDIEHGKKKEVSGKEVDALLKSAEEYLKRIKKVFEDINERKDKENAEKMQDAILDVTRDALKTAGVNMAKENEIVDLFEKHLVSTSKVSSALLKMLKSLLSSKLKSKDDLNKLRKDSKDYIKYLVDYMQRTRARDLDRLKIKIKNNKVLGEIILLQKEVFIVQETDKIKKIYKATVKTDGTFENLKEITVEEMDKTIDGLEILPKVAVKLGLFESLKKIFGDDYDIFFSN